MTLGFFFSSSFNKRESNSHQSSTSDKILYREEGNIKDISFIGENDGFLVAKGFSFVGSRYLVGPNYKILESEKDDYTKREYTGFRYYDLEDNLKEHEVDVLKEVQQEYPDAYIDDFVVFETEHYKIVKMGYLPSKDSPSRDSKAIYYDVDGHEFFVPDNIATKSSDFNAVSGYTNLGEITLDKKGFTVISSISWRGPERVTDTNLNLFDQYPDLQDKMVNQGYVIFPLKSRLSLSSYYDTLLNWFAPKGEAVLPGVVIEAYYSIDGQEHPITSYEDLKQYYNGKGGELSE